MFPSLRLATLCLGVSLAACTQTTPDVYFPAPDYSAQAPIRLQAGSIEVVDNSQSATTKPGILGDRIETRFPNPPADLIRKWANQRLIAVGGPNRVVVTIDDASAIQKTLPKKTGIEGAFTKEQAWNVDTNARVRVQLFTPEKNFAAAEASAQASASKSIREDASPYERDKAYNELTQTLLASLTTELDRQVNGYFGKFKAY